MVCSKLDLLVMFGTWVVDHVSEIFLFHVSAESVYICVRSVLIGLGRYFGVYQDTIRSLFVMARMIFFVNRFSVLFMCILDVKVIVFFFKCFGDLGMMVCGCLV